MNCNVHGVYKNLRYRILIVDDQTYILDLGRSFWKIVFPFLFWMCPNPIFKVEDQETLKKIKAPDVQQVNTGGRGLIGGGIAVLVANLLKSLTDYFDIQSSPFVNSIIVMIAIIFLLSLRFYINYLNKRNFYQVIKLEDLPKDYLWLRPKPVKHFSLVSGIYLFFMGFTVLGFYAFIEFPNVMILFSIMLLCLFALFVSAIPVPIGNTSVKFQGVKAR